MKNIILGLLAKICLFFLSVGQVSAAPVINEVVPNPANNDLEWVEIFNPDDQSIDLVGWQLTDRLSSPSTIFNFGNQNLEPGQYLIIRLEASKLNNDGDGVVLMNQNHDEVDAMDYVGSELGQSWARWPNGLAREDGGSFVVANPSPGEPNSVTLTPAPTPSPTLTPTPIPSPSPTVTPQPSPSMPILPSYLRLSEIYACPDSNENEWIEIYNQSDQNAVLTDWKIIDSSYNTKSISLSISAHSLAVIEWSGSFLNNTGDSVTLQNPQGETSFVVNFSACTKTQSLIQENGSWCLTSTPTKNAVNLFTSSNPSPDSSPIATPTPTPASPPPTPISNQSDFDLDLESANYYPDENTDPDSLLSLPALDVYTATDSAAAQSDSIDSTTPKPPPRLITQPPTKTQALGLLGTSAALIGGSCWSLLGITKRKGDSFP